MSKKENKYSYFVSYMYMPDGADIYMPGNMQLDLDREIRTGVDIRKVEEIRETMAAVDEHPDYDLDNDGRFCLNVASRALDGWKGGQ